MTLAHLWLGDELMEDRLGFGAGAQSMRRIEVSYVRELALAPPPEAPAPAPPSVKRPRKAVAPKPPASAPQPAAESPAPVVARAEPPTAPAIIAETPATEPAPPPAAGSEPVPPAPDAAPAASPPAAPAVAAAASAPSASAPSFDWPPSTRLTYRLTGYYRGDVQGSASVEWIRSGSRYQVHLEAVVGPPFAPLLVRRASSEGELGDTGLTPRRFEGEQRVAFRNRRWTMGFEPDRVRLPDGREVPAAPGVQDEASLFVQLTWLFTTQPHLLKVGRSIEVPLALPRRVEPWQYDVVAEETLQMPFADVPTMHVKPRRLAKPSGDLTAEMWFAPGLQYLPVRILVHQDAQTFIDLQLLRAPQQAATR